MLRIFSKCFAACDNIHNMLYNGSVPQVSCSLEPYTYKRPLTTLPKALLFQKCTHPQTSYPYTRPPEHFSKGQIHKNLSESFECIWSSCYRAQSYLFQEAHISRSEMLTPMGIFCFEKPTSHSCFLGTKGYLNEYHKQKLKTSERFLQSVQYLGSGHSQSKHPSTSPQAGT